MSFPPEQALWAFVSIEGVELTNNDGECAVRSILLWRKSSFGTWSERGSRFAERIVTRADSLKQQGRSLQRFLADSLYGAPEGDPAPRLIT